LKELIIAVGFAVKNGLLWLNLWPNALNSTLNPLQLPNTCKLGESTLIVQGGSNKNRTLEFVVSRLGWMEGETPCRHAVSGLAAWFILFRGCAVTCVSHGRSVPGPGLVLQVLWLQECGRFHEHQSKHPEQLEFSGFPGGGGGTGGVVRYRRDTPQDALQFGYLKSLTEEFVQ
jgi:hypothetical protein